MTYEVQPDLVRSSQSEVNLSDCFTLEKSTIQIDVEIQVILLKDIGGGDLQGEKTRQYTLIKSTQMLAA